MNMPTSNIDPSDQNVPEVTADPNVLDVGADPWSQRHPRMHGAAGVLVAMVAGCLVWWAAVDAFTPDGRNTFWVPWWFWVVAGLFVIGAGVAGGFGTWFARRRWCARSSAGEIASKPESVSWSQRHPWIHSAVGALGAAGVAFVVWWALVEASTADGRNVWWEPWFCITTGLFVIVAGAAGRFTAQLARRKLIDRSSAGGEGGEISLLWLVIAGIFVAVVLGAVAAYWQAELLTAPGESIGAIESGELLDIARATTFGLGALGAVAVLIVNYRKQKSTETALEHDQKKLEQDQTKHEEMLEQAKADLAYEREKHEKQVELEREKQKASEIAALHERFTKAVGQLADAKPAIRLGGVHAIAGIAADWKAQGEYIHHQSCVDLLCAYLRSDPPSEPKAAGSLLTSSIGEVSDVKKDQTARKAALEALSRIKKPPKRGGLQDLIRNLIRLDGINPRPELLIDLRGTDLRGLDLRKARLVGLPLNEVDLTGADLTGADLTGARLIGTKVGGADFAGTTLLDVRPDAATLSSFGALNIPETPAEQEAQVDGDAAKAD